MINAIKNIGAYVRENNAINLADYLVNTINSDSIKDILLINVEDEKTSYKIEDFYNGITSKALFYQAGNGVLGGGIRVDFYKKEEKEILKFEKKIKAASAFCECEERFEEIKEAVYKYINGYGVNCFAVILKDGKYPIDLFTDKFMDKMYSTMFKSIKGKHICHFCGEKSEVFNTTTYKFYTNDKEVYGNVDEKDKAGVTMCKNCLEDVIVGKKYVEDKLTTYWMDKSVMFLPHYYDDIMAAIYEQSIINEEKQAKFIEGIRNNEIDVLDMMGKSNAETDIIFFEKDGNKTFYIYHYIKSVLPSRFTLIGNLLEKYNLRLFNIINYLSTVKVSINEAESTFKEKMKAVDAIFIGRKIDRNLFFKRSMAIYKFKYLKQETKGIIYNIGKIYNFLVDDGCLKGGFEVMKKYKNYEELFNENKDYFNSNEKKAWFLIGKCYDYINYYIRKSQKSLSEEGSDRTSLDKNFFFARKFDFKDFIYFSNLLNDKAIKYRVNTIMFKNMITEAKELMAARENKLSCDEAKYIFFWGIDSYFEKISSEEAIDLEESELEE